MELIKWNKKSLETDFYTYGHMMDKKGDRYYSEVGKPWSFQQIMLNKLYVHMEKVYPKSYFTLYAKINLSRMFT